MLQSQSQVSLSSLVPHWFIEVVKSYTPTSDGRYAAQLLWQRGKQNLEQLVGFLDPDAYQPTSPFAFGQEMKWAVRRLQKAREAGEKVTIWGDFDADGITATSVLWEGLGQFFGQHQQLNYCIPNRLRESHGLNCSGIKKLAESATKLIITCDTGSTNLIEIEYAQQLGIDIIITDHHTLPEERPPVVSIINSRYFAETHPLFHLSGVAVAYKLVESLYQTFPDIPQQPLESLLDLVAIGLIADLVQLSGDCRYLAQKGIQQLQKQTTNPTRPGVAKLLELCQKNGDRPTDISYGLGPRINAVSRIQGDASFCVELLTSRDSKHCQQLAEATELANTRRKSLQKEVSEQVKKKLSRLDLSTNHVIVLEDSQWQGGILGLVAGQIAQAYNRPTILLSTAEKRQEELNDSILLARGSARSVNNIDLYQLLKSQMHLLHHFGGHPLAAGLSLPVENIPLFHEAINQQLRQQSPNTILLKSNFEADLIVTVSELGKTLFRELKLLEPYGMGNPIPKLLIQNCWFDEVWNNNAKDFKGNPVQYIRTTFNIWDNSVDEGFPGIWWEHYKEDLPQNQLCDAIVELDFNSNAYNKKTRTYETRYEVRLIKVCSSPSNSSSDLNSTHTQSILDWRNQINQKNNSSLRILKSCPTSLDEIQVEYRQAILEKTQLALAYSFPKQLPPQEIWQQLIGIVKHLSRTDKTISKEQLQEKLELSDRTLKLGLQTLSHLGFNCTNLNQVIKFHWSAEVSETVEQIVSTFLAAVEEEQFQRQYFSNISIETLQEMLLNSEL